MPDTGLSAAAAYIPLRTDQRPDTIYAYFTIPIFMGMAIGILITFFVSLGRCTLPLTHTRARATTTFVLPTGNAPISTLQRSSAL